MLERAIKMLRDTAEDTIRVHGIMQGEMDKANDLVTACKTSMKLLEDEAEERHINLPPAAKVLNIPTPARLKEQLSECKDLLVKYKARHKKTKDPTWIDVVLLSKTSLLFKVKELIEVLEELKDTIDSSTSRIVMMFDTGGGSSEDEHRAKPGLHQAGRESDPSRAIQSTWNIPTSPSSSSSPVDSTTPTATTFISSPSSGFKERVTRRVDRLAGGSTDCEVLDMDD